MVPSKKGGDDEEPEELDFGKKPKGKKGKPAAGEEEEDESEGKKGGKLSKKARAAHPNASCSPLRACGVPSSPVRMLQTQDQKKQAKQAAYEASLEEVAAAPKAEDGEGEEPLEDLDFGSKKKGKAKTKGKPEVCADATRPPTPDR